MSTLTSFSSDSILKTGILESYSAAEIAAHIAAVSSIKIQGVAPAKNNGIAALGLQVNQLIFAWTMAKNKVRQALTTPFNCAESITSRGGSIMPDVKSDGSGSLVVKMSGSTVKLPVVQGVPDTAPLSELGVPVTPTSPFLVRICYLFASLTDIRKGLVTPVTMASNVTGLFGLDSMFQSYEATSTIIAYEIQQIINKMKAPGESWSLVTLRGTKYAELLYKHFIGEGKGDFGVLRDRLNELVRVKQIPGSKHPRYFIFNDGGKYGLHSPSISLPAVIAGEPFNHKKQIASIEQAYTVLEAARTARGENAGERGVMSRTSYMPVMLDPYWSEVSYWATDLLNLQLPKEIRILFDASAVAKAKEVMTALKAVGYDGVVHLSNTINPTTYLNMVGGQYDIKGAKYKIVMHSGFSIMAEKMKPILLLDLRAISHRRRNMIDTLTEGKKMLKERLEELAHYASAYIVHMPMLDVNASQLSYAKSVRGHNLIAYGIYGHKVNDSVRFGINDFPAYYYTSMILNISRVVKPILGNTLFNIVGIFKLGFGPVVPVPLELSVGIELEETDIFDAGDVMFELERAEEEKGDDKEVPRQDFGGVDF
jgi:hypothetical protein